MSSEANYWQVYNSKKTDSQLPKETSLLEFVNKYFYDIKIPPYIEKMVQHYCGRRFAARVSRCMRCKSTNLCLHAASGFDRDVPGICNLPREKWKMLLISYMKAITMGIGFGLILNIWQALAIYLGE
jgi:hypothetical protein